MQFHVWNYSRGDRNQARQKYLERNLDKDKLIPRNEKENEKIC